MFMISAQFDNPPDFFFENMCNAIDGAPEGTSILVRTAAGLNASIFGNQSCHDVYQFKKGKLAWPWQYVFQTNQTRTEIVIPMGTGGNDTMFQASPFNLTEYTETCIEVFGGHDKNLHSEILQATSSSPMDFGIHTLLECFGGHIRHCCGCTYRTRVLEDISDSVVALYTEQGAHFLDLYPSSLSGPDWLVALREKDEQILHIGLLSSMPNMINNS